MNLIRTTSNLMAFMRHYLRLKVEGTECLPREGSAIILPNHSGWAGLDALMIRDAVYRTTHRLPPILAHKAFFAFREVRLLARQFGLRRASLDTGLRVLRGGNPILLFPEGEDGNFKPTAARYRLQHFHTGFVRMALRSGSPIVPTIVIGAEESNINLARLRWGRLLKAVPLPLNLFPLPAKWKIRFLPPIRFDGFGPECADDEKLVHQLAYDVRRKMQRAITSEVKHRDSVYFSAA